MRIAALAPLLALAACDGWTVPPRVQPDALSGCDDPAVWTAPIPKLAEARSFLAGDHPCTVQLPIGRVSLEWAPTDSSDDDLLDHAQVCWRVTKASPTSGWTEGQTFETSRSGETINVKGFARPVTVEGRVLRGDNTVALGIGPMTIALRPGMIVLPDASTVIAVMGADSWAERDAVQLWGLRIATDEVLDAATILGRSADDAFTLHRVGGNIVRRTWSKATGQIEQTDVVIGPGTSGRITKWGNAAVVDNELVIFGRDSQNPIVRYRIALDAAPLEMTEDGSSVTLHMPGKLLHVDINSGASATRSVGDGQLVQAFNLSPPLFFDGTEFRQIWMDHSAIVLSYPYIPSAEDLTRIGKPVAEMDSVIIGERGFLATNIWTTGDSATLGPSVATYAELFGGGHLGPLSDTASYVMVHDDGSSKLYTAPFGGYCSPL